MRRDRPKIFVFIISLIIFTFIIMGREVFAANAEMQKIKELEKQETKVPVTISRPQVVYSAEDLKDPFQKPTMKGAAEGGAKKQAPALTVQGIIWGEKLSQAIINNKVVRVGDTIEGVKILSIDKNGVTVFFEEGQYVLSSPAAAIRTSQKPEGGAK